MTENIEQLGSELRELLKQLNELKEQVTCGVQGHRITIKYSASWDDPLITFQCVDCEVQYQKNASRINAKEKTLFDAFNLKPEQDEN